MSAIATTAAVAAAVAVTDIGTDISAIRKGKFSPKSAI